jgi:hypothetical protein
MFSQPPRTLSRWPSSITTSLSQMVPVVHIVGWARFSYSVALVPWSDPELGKVYKTWLQVHRAAWRLPPCFLSAPFVLPG